MMERECRKRCPKYIKAQEKENVCKYVFLKIENYPKNIKRTYKYTITLNIDYIYNGD